MISVSAGWQFIVSDAPFAQSAAERWRWIAGTLVSQFDA
jgi:hypothetical protein